MPIPGIFASQISGYLDPSAYFPIATTTLATGTNTISFTSIPSTYKHLQIRILARSATASAGLGVRVNTDSGMSYTVHYVQGNGTTATSAGLATGTLNYGLVGFLPQSASLASAYNGTIIDILDYTDTSKNKTIRSLSGEDVNGTGGDIRLSSVLWTSTSAITQLDFICNTGGNAISQYSSFTLYGIKG
jgi:hypothetical protein